VFFGNKQTLDLYTDIRN